MVTVVLGAALLAAAGAVAGAGARVLVGRLRRGARVAPPWCEAALAVVWGLTGGAWAAGALPAAWLPAILGLGWFAVAAGAVDLRHRRLPDALTLPALPVALVLLLPVGPAAAARGAGGAALAVGVHAAVHFADRRAVGAGDVKLAAPLGAVLAAAAWPALALGAVLAAALTTALAATPAAVAGGGPDAAGGPTPVSRGPEAVSKGPDTASVEPVAASAVGAGGAGPQRRRRLVPHGPAMLAATWLVTMWLVGVGAASNGGGG